MRSNLPDGNGNTHITWSSDIIPISSYFASCYQFVTVYIKIPRIYTHTPQEVASFLAQQHGTTSTAEDIARTLIESKCRNTGADLM